MNLSEWADKHLTAFMPPMANPIIGDSKEGPSVAGYHKIVDFLRCPREYQFRYVQGIKHKDTEPKSALLVGILAHVGRAHWFGSQFRATIEESLDAISAHVRTQGLSNAIEAEKEAKRIIAAYIEHWRSKPLPLCRAVEYPIGPCPMKPGDPFFLYRTARFDDLSNYPDALNKLCIGDLKTTSDSISATLNEYRQNGQFILYHILYKMAKEGQALFGPVDGIMIDIATKDKVPAFHRERIQVTPFQEHWFTASMQGYLRAAAGVTETSPVPRNVSQCSRSVSRKGSFMCEYHPLCARGDSAAGQFVDFEGKRPRKEIVEL